MARKTLTAGAGVNIVETSTLGTISVELTEGSNITITSGSSGAITIAANSGSENTLDQAYDEGGTGQGRFITVDSGPVQIDASSLFPEDVGLAITGSIVLDFGGLGKAWVGPKVEGELLRIEDEPVGASSGHFIFEPAILNASGAVVSAQLGLSGSLTRLYDGTSYIIAGDNVIITSASNGAVTIAASTGSASGDVSGPSVSVDNEIVRFDGTTGKVIQATPVSAPALPPTVGDTANVAINASGSTAALSIDQLATAGTALHVLKGSTRKLLVDHNVQVTGSFGALIEDYPAIIEGAASFTGGSTTVGIMALVSGALLIQDAVPPNIQAQIYLDNHPDGVARLVLAGGDVFRVLSPMTALFDEGAIFNLGLSGSHTKLIDGSSAFIAGDNVTITSASNGAVTIAANTGSGTGDVSGPVSSTDNAIATWDGTSGDTLQNSRVLITDTPGTQALVAMGAAADDAAGDDLFLQAQVGGVASAVSGGIGGDAQLWAGTGGAGTAGIAAGAGGDVFINAGFSGFDNGGGPGIGGDVFIRAGFGDTTNGEVVIGDTDTKRIRFGDDDQGDGRSAVAFQFIGTGSLVSTGSGVFLNGLSGSLTRLIDGSSYLEAGDNVTITSASNGAVTITAAAGGGGSDQFTDNGGNLATTASLSLGVTTAPASTDTVLLVSATHANPTATVLVDQAGGGDASIRFKTTDNWTFGIDQSVDNLFKLVNSDELNTTVPHMKMVVTGGQTTDGPVFPMGMSGSLTRLQDGTSYLQAGSNITITSASNGAVTIASTGGGGNGGIVLGLAGAGLLEGATYVNGPPVYVRFDNAQNDAWTINLQVPSGTTAITSIEVLYRSDATGNLYLGFIVTRYREGETTQTDTLSESTYAAGGAGGQLTAIALPAAAYDTITVQADDIISILVRRDATNASDTYEIDLLVTGVRVTFE